MKRNIIMRVSVLMLAFIVASFFASCGESDNTTENSEQEVVALTGEDLFKSVSDMKNNENAGKRDEEDIREISDEEITEEKSGADENNESDERNIESTDSIIEEAAEDSQDDNKNVVSSASGSTSVSQTEDSENTVVDFSDSYSVSSANDPETCIHNYGQGVIASAATCTKDGTRVYTCSKCGAVKSTTIPATGHTYETSVSKEATCGTNGVRLHKCSVCGDSYTTTIPATGNHNYQPVYKTVYHDATGHYETQNTGMYKCNYDGCGELFATVNEVSDHIDLTHDGHASYSAVDVETEVWAQDNAAYDERVIDYYKCTVCGAIE